MGLFGLFSKSAPPDYETLLARLSTEIDEARVHLSEIRLRERRWSLLVNIYGIALWAVLLGLWWFRHLPLGLFGWHTDGIEAKIVGGAIVGAAPILVWSLNQALHFIFSRQRNTSETKLRALLAKQKKHVDEIKKATNYDSTRKLIERYDASAGAPGGSPMSVGRGQGSPSRSAPGTPTPAGKGTPKAPGHLMGIGGTPAQGPSTPVTLPPGVTPDQALALHAQMQAIQPILPTPEKRWYDRVVDSILGDDPSQAATSKYALVCGECFRHNGLVGGKREWERMQWICPRCNHMNPAPLSRLNESSAGNSDLPTVQPTHREVPAPTTPSQLSRTTPKSRRAPGNRGTPRTSKLGQEVYSASTDEGSEDRDDAMDVDDK